MCQLLTVRNVFIKRIARSMKGKNLDWQLKDLFFYSLSFFLGGVAYTISSISSSAFLTLLNVLSCPFVNLESAI